MKISPPHPPGVLAMTREHLRRRDAVKHVKVAWRAVTPLPGVFIFQRPGQESEIVRSSQGLNVCSRAASPLLAKSDITVSREKRERKTSPHSFYFPLSWQLAFADVTRDPRLLATLSPTHLPISLSLSPLHPSRLHSPSTPRSF